MRLDKFLADMGCGTRKELRNLIRKGNASVDGAIVHDPGYHLTGNEDVRLNGETVRHEAFAYYMLNKPAGVISASSDPRARTVIDLIDEPNKRRDLFPVGRLDRDTEGLLLITNDGDLAHRLLAPGKHVPKVYEAEIGGIVTEEDVRRFREGLCVDEDFTALPAELVILPGKTVLDNNKKSPDGIGSEEKDISRVRITIREGKYHQIKRMFLAVGKEVLYLKRISMGPLTLDPALPPGGCRRLTDNEKRALKI